MSIIKEKSDSLSGFKGCVATTPGEELDPKTAQLLAQVDFSYYIL